MKFIKKSEDVKKGNGKSTKIEEFLNEISKKVSTFLPDYATGKEEEFRRLLYKVSGEETDFSKIENQRLEVSKRYILVIGVALIWLSFTLLNIGLNQEVVVFEKDGKQYVNRNLAKEVPKSLELVVKGESEKEEINKKVSLVVNPKGYIRKKQKEDEIRLKKSKTKSAEEDLRLKLYQIAEKDDKNAVELPKNAGSIEKLLWNAEKDRSYLMIILLGIVGLAVVYLGRYDKFKKMERLANESVEKELAEFFNKLVLLLNAGLVFTSAFEKTVEYGASGADASYFYKELWKIKKKSEESNASIVIELKKFSKRTENKEFIRVVNVISDNISRGTELVPAMQTESELLSYQRRKRAEERAKIAETKLTIPLAMQLVSLILITLAPALLDM